MLVFDPSLYVDDVKTPASVTIKPATVVCRYGYKYIYRGNISYDDLGNKHGDLEEWLYPDCVDVIFDHRPERISKGHFTKGVEMVRGGCTMSVYTDNGYEDREEYLHSLVDEHEVDAATVFAIAELYGPEEDFDGLVTALEDYKQ